MKKALKILLICVLIIALAAGGFFGWPAISDRLNSSAAFFIDFSDLGRTLPNPVSNINVWDMSRGDWVNAERNEENDIFDFVEYVQFMQATGGNRSRDLFLDPDDRTVLDDYDFTTLIESCRSVVNLGAKPHLKLGSVPNKYTEAPERGAEFGMNIYPPSDYTVYYNYIAAIANALVGEFGLEEVRSWHFGVMTEFNNDGWFQEKGNDSEADAVAYNKLYDYTVAALQSVLGEEIYIGAHALAQSDGRWSVELFVKHCAEEVNYCTGEIGTRLCYLAGSHYDVRPGFFAPLSRNLPDTIGYLRNIAEKYGYTDLVYGIDEGGFLMGHSSGNGSNNLASRSVGYTYQGAYDARRIKEMFDNDITYVSVWSYLSGGNLAGNPSVSYHVAHEAAKFSGAKRAEVTKVKGSLTAEVETVAAYDESADTVIVMAYNFKNSVNYKGVADVTLDLNIPQFEGRELTVTTFMIDDDTNFFDEWVADRKAYGIGDDAFSWSPDDHEIDTSGVLRDEAAIELFRTELFEKYREASRLTPTTESFTMDGSTLGINLTLQPNAVAFLEIGAKQ